MTILAFDIGGSAVKYGLWLETNLLVSQGAFPLPESWSKLKSEMLAVFKSQNVRVEMTGIAISAPGIVDNEKGEIRGISAVPYIHNFPILEDLRALFGLPVTMENDANCAALAEVWLGAAKDVQNSIFVVIGTGIGGAIVLNRQLYKGRNLFAGEFGYMYLDDKNSLTALGSVVTMLETYYHQTNKMITGQELFDLAAQGDEQASDLLGDFYQAIAKGIYNLLVCLNPDRVLLGGGVSKNPHLIPNIEKKLQVILEANDVRDLDYELVTCEFGNDANLIGAVYHFMNQG